MKRDGFNHTKARMLCNLLDLPGMWAAHGLMESLWQLTAREAPQGDIGKRSDAMIAAGLDWRDDPEKLIAALVTAELLDRHPTCRLAVHDWHEHADGWIRKRLERAGLPFLSDNGRQQQTTGTDGEPCSPSRAKGEARLGEARRGSAGGEWGGGARRFEPGWIDAIRDLYPSRCRGGRAGDHEAIATVLAELADRGIENPVEWLSERVRLFAASWAGKRGQYTKKLKTWCEQGCWDQDPDEWGEPEGSDGFDPSIYAEETQ